MAAEKSTGGGALRTRLVAALFGAVGAMIVLSLGAFIYIETGAFDVAASNPHGPLMYWATRTMMLRSVKLRARKVAAPARFTQTQVAAGFRIYEARCVGCHGAPALGARGPWVDGMTPLPPYLLGASRDFTAPELFWIIRNGVKMTGMPAWSRACEDREIWEVVAFLEALPRMKPGGYRELRAAAASTAPLGGQPRPAPCRAADLAAS